MKLLIASDIHGSAYYCEKLIERIKAEKPDRILLLGDILYHGPRNDLPHGYDPKRTAELLNEYKNLILCVRGNCDSEVDGMLLKFPMFADYAFLCIDNITLFATHGHKYSPENLPPLKAGDILLNGHTHIPALKQNEGYTYINPGSVSIPKENSEHEYLCLENGAFCWKNLAGEILKTYTV